MRLFKKFLTLVLLVVATTALLLPAELAEARGGGRGGGGGGGGRGGGGGYSGGARGGGGGARVSSGASRSAGRSPSRSTGYSSSSRNRSSFDYSRASTRPSTRPAQPARPSYPSNIERPSGGAGRYPSQLPSQIQRPSNYPSGQYGRPGQQPSRLPSYDYTQRPATRPSYPTAPTARPLPGGGRPSQADLDHFLRDRPATGPNVPSQLPANRPARPLGGEGGSRPSQLPSERPARPGGEPGIATRPVAPGGAAGIANRPGRPGDGTGISTLPARPGQGLRPGERPGFDNRPGERPLRPEQLPAEWNDRWNNWQDQADNIRDDWYNDYYNHHYDNWYHDDWWYGHHHPYYPYYDYCDDCDWWSCPSTWMALGSFVGAALTPAPVYYTYGSGGTVYVEGDTVVLSGDEQVPAEEYTRELVEQSKAVPEEATEELQWMPLGVFSIVDEEAPESSLFFQLTISQTGVIAGMFQNTTTDTSVPIEGSVDSQSRAVWTPVGKSFPLVETGLYNLIQDQTQVLAHFKDGTIEERLLVRLDKPMAPQGSASQPETPQSEGTQKEGAQTEGTPEK